MHTVNVRYKDHFGVSTIVPDCEISRIYADIAQTKTLTKPTIDAMKRLGVVFNVVQEQRSV